jgi:ubiquinone biosynthesis protein
VVFALQSSVRFFAIIGVILKYRLDTLVRNKPLPWFVRAVLFFPGLLPDPKKNRGERIRLACEELGPIFIKFGQLLSTRPDLIPADIVNELDRLQDDVPPFSNLEFQRIVEQALGDKVENLFVKFDREPLASASVAQVHTATIALAADQEQEVVVKVIRPGIETTIKKDIQLMRWLARLLENSGSDGKRLRPVEVVEEYRHTITNELNLQREAANASQLRRNFSQSPLLYVPEIYWPYVRHNVMVMERIHGVPVTDMAALKAAGTNLKVLAERGVEIFFTQVFEHNFFHADMHPGNIFVDCTNPDQPNYIALDMAIVTSLNREDQYYLARNLLAMFRRDYRQVAELYVTSGWVAADTDINDFEASIRSMCEPIFEKPLKDISFAQVLIALFQTARRFDMTIQPQLVLLQKTLLNIEGLGRQLYPDLDLWSTAHPFLERWLQQRFHPKTLLQQLKRYGPEWMEKFPQVPQLVFSGLEQVNQVKVVADQWQREMTQQQRRGRGRRIRRLLAGLCFGSVIYLTWPVLGQSIQAIPPTGLILLVVGAILWLIG